MISSIRINSIVEGEKIIGQLKADQAIGQEITSISIAIPADEEAYGVHCSHYASIYSKQISGSDPDYDIKKENLAREVYQTHVLARTESLAKAHALISSLVELLSPRIEHIEHILPVWPEPSHIFDVLEGLPSLKSLSIQWRHAPVDLFASLPIRAYQDALDEFTRSFRKCIATLPQLRRLRLSLPQAFLPRYGPFTCNVLERCLSDPQLLPELETLDLTHTAPGYDTVLRILDTHPLLLYLILDQGAEFRDREADIACMDDSDEEEYNESITSNPQTQAQKIASLGSGWAGLGAYLATHPACKLRAISAAMGDSAVHMFSIRLTDVSLRNKLAAGAVAVQQCSDATEINAHAEERISAMSVCTAWPTSHCQKETQTLPGYETENNLDVYRHAEACAHISGFPSDQRPRIDVWPAKSSEELSYLRNIY